MASRETAEDDQIEPPVALISHGCYLYTPSKPFYTEAFEIKGDLKAQVSAY